MGFCKFILYIFSNKKVYCQEYPLLKLLDDNYGNSQIGSFNYRDWWTLEVAILWLGFGSNDWVDWVGGLCCPGLDVSSRCPREILIGAIEDGCPMSGSWTWMCHLSKEWTWLCPLIEVVVPFYFPSIEVISSRLLKYGYVCLDSLNY